MEAGGKSAFKYEVMVQDRAQLEALMVELLNERARNTEELETVLVQLSNDPEMKLVQDEHEREKADVTKRSMELQEELRSAETSEHASRKRVDAQLDGGQGLVAILEAV